MKGRDRLSAILAAAAFAACAGGAEAAGIDDMKACAAVGSPAVRLACFDAAAKGIQSGDIAACARVSADAVRLACFNAAAGGAPAAAAPKAAPAPAAAPAARPPADLVQTEEIMRTREAAIRARLEEMQRQAAEMERRAAEIERRAAEAAERTAQPAGQPADPVASFGGGQENPEAGFGDRNAPENDPLTAEKYGASAKADDEGEDDGSPDRIKKIAVPIKAIKKDPYGKVTVTLENGQVWKQVDNTRSRWSKEGENVAHIRRAWLGSFLMTINDEGAALRVRRVK